MDACELMDGVEAVLRRSFPQLHIYVDRLPKDFKRPSMTLELAESHVRDLNFALVERQADFLVTCYGAVNAYHDSSRKGLNQMQSQVMDLFSAPMEVAGRWLLAKVNQGEGGVEFDQVELSFTWADVRPGMEEPSDPAIKQIEMNWNGKDDG